MKRYGWILLFLLGIGSLAGAVFTQKASALPEYAAQTGEPCASCHVSPSGGGPRTPRGQAWVGSGKPGAVPGLVEALEALGVHLTADQSDYQAPAASPAPALPLEMKAGQSHQIQEWLNEYEGN
jgi:anti-sigma factor RsiW